MTTTLPVQLAPGIRLTPEQLQIVVPATAAMLQAGKTYAEITAEVGISSATAARIRQQLHLPLTSRRRTRTFAEAFALHTEPYGDGHTRWTGPMRGRMPQLCAERRRVNARHYAFELHHGRRPHGYVRTACTEPGCLTGSHLTDNKIRAQTGGTA
ncbi:hypothetical protein [Streptomyces griseosporeus]|uniref:hypothetical protein n=1 Tax=Streptomyces griseosporeus TaxID=1910 RepID=UPI0036FE01D2